MLTPPLASSSTRPTASESCARRRFAARVASSCEAMKKTFACAKMTLNASLEARAFDALTSRRRRAARRRARSAAATQSTMKRGGDGDRSRRRRDDGERHDEPRARTRAHILADIASGLRAHCFKRAFRRSSPLTFFPSHSARSSFTSARTAAPAAAAAAIDAHARARFLRFTRERAAHANLWIANARARLPHSSPPFGRRNLAQKHYSTDLATRK